MSRVPRMKDNLLRSWFTPINRDVVDSNLSYAAGGIGIPPAHGDVDHCREANPAIFFLCALSSKEGVSK
ncbi:hypothetical protein K2Y11_13975 [bacterium]|nr:hypothetical protein [bacterium]